MAFDWKEFAKDAGDLAFGPKPVAEPVIDTASEPPLVAPMSADQELQAAGTVMPQSATHIAPTVTPSQMQPQIQPQVTMPQPGMLPMQQTVQQNVLSPMAKSEMRIAGMGVDDAIQAKADADIAANNAVAEEQRARAALAQQHADEAEAAAAARREEAATKRADIETAVQNYDQNSKINPNRYKENMGVGGRVVAAIAQGLGAFGAAITHSPNFAQELIEKAVNADIRAQEHDVATLGHKVNLAQNQYANFRNQGMDEDAARTATYALKMQSANAKIDALLAGTKNQQIQASANEIKALNAQRTANALADYEKRQVATTSVAVPPGGAKPSLEDVTKLKSMAEADTDLKQFRSAREASRRFAALRSAGADGSAIMDFIATGLKQGSFTPTFIDMLQKRGLVGKAKEVIRSAVHGGYDPKLLEELQRSVDANTAVAMQGAMPVVRQLQSMGLPPSLSIGGDTATEQAQQLGVKPLQ